MATLVQNRSLPAALQALGAQCRRIRALVRLPCARTKTPPPGSSWRAGIPRLDRTVHANLVRLAGVVLHGVRGVGSGRSTRRSSDVLTRPVAGLRRWLSTVPT